MSARWTRIWCVRPVSGRQVQKVYPPNRSFGSTPVCAARPPSSLPATRTRPPRGSRSEASMRWASARSPRTSARYVFSARLLPKALCSARCAPRVRAKRTTPDVLALLAGRVAVGGPLGPRTQGALRELFLAVTAADAGAIEHSEIEVRWSVANTWNEPMILQRGREWASQTMDEQADALTVRV